MIDSRDTIVNPITVISASAGTGKTYRLSLEYLNGLRGNCQDSADLVHVNSGIIATTFTNKAADELVGRVRRVLLDDGDWHNAQGVLTGYLGTVNSLCGRLLSEHAIDAGLSPDLTVIGEERLPAVFAIAVDSVIHEYADEMHGPANRLKLDNWRKDVQKVIDFARDNNMDASDMERLAEDSWNSLSALLSLPDEGTGDELDELLASVLDKTIQNLPGKDDFTQSTRLVIENLSDINMRVKSGAHVVWQSWADMSKLNVGKGSREAIKPLIDVAQFYVRHPRLHSDIRTAIFGVFRCAAAAMQKYSDYKKEHGLIDFVDQELLTLNLLEKSEVRDVLKDKFHLLLVDEFQDTSPIQLAIFLELAKLCRSSVWVGDEKQSIYGFRGSDPELMRHAVDYLVGATGGSKDVLKTSYRSRPSLIGFTNALFSQCSQIKNITTSSAVIQHWDRDEHPDQGNALHVWWLKGRKQEQALSSLAGGIRSLLSNPDKWSVLDKSTKQLRPIKGSDIAVLCRTNATRLKAARAFVSQGLTVATERDGLLDTPECVLVCAALRVMVDDSDTLAIAEIANLLSPEDGRWLDQLLELNGSAWLEKWLGSESIGSSETNHLSETLDCLSALSNARSYLVDKTPLEVLESAINCSGVMESILSWGNVRQRLANIDSLRGIARTYEELCSSARLPSTAAGLVVHLHKFVTGGGSQPANPDENGVHILTYHKSKGLEWPMVILFDLDRTVPGDPFGVKVDTSAAKLDPMKPLSGRTIRYWPWPFGQQKSKISLKEKADKTPQGRAAAKRALSENVRLLYVGMTRARDYLVFACRFGTGWLKCLTDEQFDQPILTLSDQQISYLAELIDDVKDSNALFTPMDEPKDIEPSSDFSSPVYSSNSTPTALPFPPYYLNPSSAGDSDLSIETSGSAQTHLLGERFPLSGTPDMRVLGDCVHAYLCLDTSSDTEESRLQKASQVVTAFGAHWISAEALPIMAERLSRFLIARYPDARIHTEMPVSGRLGVRRVRGTIDLLAETDKGLIIVDHKTFPGRFEEWVSRAVSYAPQLALYRHVVEQATAKPVIAQFVHMPVVGAMIELDCRVSPGGVKKGVEADFSV
ncbi:MAG: UvrD-helicase domain-containing protein [Candidatus Obscuribacterales bacterium]|nr:UvrD-helicase domain-containing protein [Candidatus Obscuribacterales bacterium]